MTRKVLTPDEFFVAGTITREWVPTPELPGENGDERGVYVTELGAVDGEQWEHDVTDGSGKPITGKLMVTSLSYGVVDESGNRLFTVEHAAQLAKTKRGLATRLWKVFQRLNVVGDSDVENAKKN